MKKNKIIEEIASDINFACVELSKEQRLEIARVLINLDYRKITKPIKLTSIGHGKEYGCYYADISVTGQEFPQRVYFQASLFEGEEIRKETAKEILQTIKLRAWSNNTDENGKVWNYCITVDELNEIAKQYGVEVEE